MTEQEENCKIAVQITIDKEYLKEELQGLEERVRKETAAHILSHLREWGFRVHYGRILWATGKESVDWCIGAMSCGKELTHETDVLAQEYGLNRRQGTIKYE